MKTLFRTALIAIALILTASPASTMLRAQAQSESPAAIKARMTQRLPQIDKLKESGALGENNLGYLEVRDADQNDAAAIAAAENADRKAVYQIIATQQKMSAEEVGKARAQQIAQLSRPGVWIQNAQGVWAKK